jgi:hypothetical protein
MRVVSRGHLAEGDRGIFTLQRARESTAVFLGFLESTSGKNSRLGSLQVFALASESADFRYSNA